MNSRRLFDHASASRGFISSYFRAPDIFSVYPSLAAEREMCQALIFFCIDGLADHRRGVLPVKRGIMQRKCSYQTCRRVVPVISQLDAVWVLEKVITLSLPDLHAVKS
jgi:hypothetical protein